MSIIGILAGMVLIAMGSIQKGAKDEATKALVERLNLYIADYYRKKGTLPEDGLDTTVEIKGQVLKSSAALSPQSRVLLRCHRYDCAANRPRPAVSTVSAPDVMFRGRSPPTRRVLSAHAHSFPATDQGADGR